MTDGAEVRLVVAGAVMRSGRLLLARRTYPPEVAGRWELPGGKAEPGEHAAAALRRELAEELGVVVQPGSRLDAEVDLPGPMRLIALRATLVSGEPVAEEHSALRWVDAAELRQMAARDELVAADTVWVAQLCALLDSTRP